MTDRDAIVGARYHDSVFDDDFEIVDIEPDEFDSHDPTEITVTLKYDGMGTVTIDLAQFRNEYGIELLSIDPDSA